MARGAKFAHLSKTLYMRGLQCPKSLWLDRRQPEVRTAPPPDLIARWKAGTEVGVYAQLLFPGGVEVPFDGHTKVQQLAQTKELLAKGAQTIYEATFSHEGVFVRADISWCRSFPTRGWRSRRGRRGLPGLPRPGEDAGAVRRPGMLTFVGR